MLTTINQSALAKKLKVSSQCINQWVSGKRIPKLKFIPEIANALNCSIEDVVYLLINTQQDATKKEGGKGG